MKPLLTILKLRDVGRPLEHVHVFVMGTLQDVFTAVQEKTPESLGPNAWYIATVSRVLPYLMLPSVRPHT